MGKVPAPVAKVRLAVRKCLAPLRRCAPGDVGGKAPLVLVACSGGPDSMALAAATAFVGPRVGMQVGLVSVDHGMQPGSRERAERVSAWAAENGLAPALAVSVDVTRGGGPEAAARTARYAALDRVAHEVGATAVLLGHTRDDQAETVLLALARGSGLNAIAGMSSERGRYRRPLLGLTRETTRQACQAERLSVWHDPHNEDPAYSRSRLRAILPLLEEAIGPGVVVGLARSAELAHADAAYLAAEALRCYDEVVHADNTVDALALTCQPLALRGRVLRAWALALGAPATALTLEHVSYLDDLVMHWRGQGAVYLPNGIAVIRSQGRLRTG